MEESYYNTDAKIILDRAFALIRNTIDRRYAKVLSKYFKGVKLREIMNSTRFENETQLSETQVFNLLKDYYRKGGEKS